MFLYSDIIIILYIFKKSRIKKDGNILKWIENVIY